MLLAVESEGDQQMIGIGLANRNPAKEALRTFGRTIWSAGIGDHFSIGLTHTHLMFETTSEARCLHSCSALEAAFSVRYSFQASVANAIETMQLQERGVQNCIRTEYMVFVTGFKKSKENSRTPNAPIWPYLLICSWYIPYVCLYAWIPKKRHIRFSTSLQGQHLHLSVPKSRTRRVPQPCHGEGEAGEAGRCSSPQRGPNQKWFG